MIKISGVSWIHRQGVTTAAVCQQLNPVCKGQGRTVQHEGPRKCAKSDCSWRNKLLEIFDWDQLSQENRIRANERWRQIYCSLAISGPTTWGRVREIWLRNPCSSCPTRLTHSHTKNGVLYNKGRVSVWQSIFGRADRNRSNAENDTDLHGKKSEKYV